MLWLKWFFRDDEKEFNPNKFKPKSTFNPRNKDAATEMYLSSLEEKYNNLTREERGALFDLKFDKTKFIKEQKFI